MTRTTLGMFGLLLIVLSIQGQTPRDKASPWQSFLPADAYKELTQRSIKLIEETAKSDRKDAAERIEVEAALLAGYTLSAKSPDDEDAAKLRGAARQATQAAAAKDVKKLADFAKMIPTAPKVAVGDKPAKQPSHVLVNLMEIFRGKTKGGDGTHGDLHYQPRLKNLNGIEAFLGAIAAKKLSDENLAKVSGELPTLAYRVAVAAALTYDLAPDKDAGKWHTHALQMRDASLTLADAAKRKDGDAVLKSAQSLENSCIQ